MPSKLTPAQARSLKREHEDTPQGRRDALLMFLLLDHGLRVSEAADLQVTDLDISRGLLRFYRRKVAMSQTHRLSIDTLHAAKNYLDARAAPAVGQLLRTVQRPRSSELGGAISMSGAS